jgi:hypothetical protein
MSSRRRPQSELPQQQACPSRELVALYEQHANKGLSKRLTDNAFWLDHDVDCELIEALHAIDQRGDQEPLICLLRKRGDIYLADLFERYNLRHKPGGQQIPVYDMSDIDRRLAMAVTAVREQGVALAAAADHWRIDIRALETELAGRRGSTRRARDRRRP